MKIKIEGEYLKIKFDLAEKFLALHGDITVKLKSITNTATEKPVQGWLDLRAPGTYVPWLIKAGTYYTGRGKEFWYADLRKKDKYLTINLKENSYKRLVLTIEENLRWKEKIDSSLS